MYLLWHLCVLKITAADMTMYFLHSSDSELLHHWLQSLENNIIVLVCCRYLCTYVNSV